MLEVDYKKNCTGCSACANICPRGCIRMTADCEGFLYPEVNEEQCMDCGLCENRAATMNGRALFAMPKVPSLPASRLDQNPSRHSERSIAKRRESISIRCVPLSPSASPNTPIRVRACLRSFSFDEAARFSR